MEAGTMGKDTIHHTAAYQGLQAEAWIEQWTNLTEDPHEEK